MLKCAQCGGPARLFPPEEVDGREVILTAEVPFVKRLAYECADGCGATCCAPCCHPTELVQAMLRPGAGGLPLPAGVRSPKCPKCRSPGAWTRADLIRRRPRQKRSR
jgi:hypothetical protein